jgi:hypothetical protein
VLDLALCAHVAVVSLLRVMCCVSGDASRLGRTLASRLKELLDRQQYEVIIQVVGGRGCCCVVLLTLDVGWGQASSVAMTRAGKTRLLWCC